MQKLISEIKMDDLVDQVFLVQRCEVKTAKTGSLYIIAQLADRTGTIEAKVWNVTENQIQTFNKNDFIKVNGRVETYQNNLQLIVKEVSEIDESSLSLEAFLPHTKRDIDGLMSELKEILSSIRDIHLSQLINLFFEDKDFCAGICIAPAAIQYHHAFLGGLLEHTVSLLKLALSAIPNYPMLNRDILLTGIFIHDIGKIAELSYSKGLKYTDEGMLVGHLISGVKMVNEKAKLIQDFPKDLLNNLEHLILSHHGAYEWGSPKLPMTIEAVALHYLDNLDAKINAFDKIVKEDKNKESDWTEYSRIFGRRLYKQLMS